MSEYTCAHCRKRFRSSWSDEEARQEAAENFPGLNVDTEAAVICDDCFEAMKEPKPAATLNKPMQAVLNGVVNSMVSELLNGTHANEAAYQSIDAISDEDALRMRDDAVALMIGDACKHMPSIKSLALVNTSAFAHARYLPMHESRAEGIALRSGIRLGVLDPLGEGRVKPEGMA